MSKRAFLIVLDSFGIGGAKDAAAFGDEGSNTLQSCYESGGLSVPNMAKLGLFHIDGVACAAPQADPEGAFARMQEASRGKDTTVGHWEIAGVISKSPFPTYPHGFPDAIIRAFERQTGRKVLCNRPCSGTKVIEEYGPEQEKTGALIVYTSADSVFQIAAHEDVIPLKELYEYCRVARRLLQGQNGVARVIARPYVGRYPHYTRTANRHDFSLAPPGETLLDAMQAAGFATIGVGKIFDIFAGRGLSESHPVKNNTDGMEQTIALAQTDFEGLCFVNLVDFDMVYGHRNDVAGYTAALNQFDRQLGQLLPLLRKEDIVLLTADHGCDPATPSTDHSRENTPMLLYGLPVKGGLNLGTRATFADIAATLAEYFGLAYRGDGRSFWHDAGR